MQEGGAVVVSHNVPRRPQSERLASGKRGQWGVATGENVGKQTAHRGYDEKSHSSTKPPKPPLNSNVHWPCLHFP
jgi:hypothetical protein